MDTVVNITYDFASELTAFALIDLPAYDFSTGDVQKQVQIEVDSAHQGGQIHYVPAEQLDACAALAACCGFAGASQGYGDGVGCGL